MNLSSKLYILLLSVSILLFSCSKDFEEINTDPTASATIDPEFLFSTALLQGSGSEFEIRGAMLAYSACFVQHFASIAFDWHGDKYFYDPFHSQEFFSGTYRSSLKTLTEMIHQLEESGESSNLLQAGRIWRVVLFHRITDLYGDIPYHQAGKGFIETNFKPAYDAQEEIYFDMLNELKEAHENLDSSLIDFGAGDFLFGGNVDSWKKFAASMMLRLGMRLVKIAPSEAESWVKLAISLGVNTDGSANAIIWHSDGPEPINQNGIGLTFEKNDNSRLSRTFINHLDSLEDPRLNILSWVESGGEHKGLPNGYDELNLTQYSGGADLATYSRVNPALIQRNSPMMFQFDGEVQFLLAEAAVRGWYDGDPIAHYEAGIWSSMYIWSWFDPALTFEGNLVVDYLQNNPLDLSNEVVALERIASEYWIATFLNPLESYANWRRTGYPNLIPVNFPGSDSPGAIPRRLRYPQKEYSVNSDNITIANQRQGSDIFTTRIWWDKE